MTRRITLDFIERKRFHWKRFLYREGTVILAFLLICQLGIFFFYYVKSRSITKEVAQTERLLNFNSNKIKTLEEEVKNLKISIYPLIKSLNEVIERKNFNYTKAFRILEESLPAGCYLLQINFSSKGKVLLVGRFASSEKLKAFMQNLSQKGRYAVFLTKEYTLAGGESQASIVWDLSGEGK